MNTPGSTSLLAALGAAAVVGAATAASTILAAVVSSGVAFADLRSVVVSFAGLGAGLGLGLGLGRRAAARVRRGRTLVLLAGSLGAVLLGAGTFSLLVRGFSGHFPWDLRWPAATLVMAHGWPAVIRHAVVAAVALTAGQVVTSRHDGSAIRRAGGVLLTGAVAAAFLGIPVLLNGEMSWSVWRWCAAAAPVAALFSLASVPLARRLEGSSA